MMHIQLFIPESSVPIMIITFFVSVLLLTFTIHKFLWCNVKNIDHRVFVGIMINVTLWIFGQLYEIIAKNVLFESILPGVYIFTFASILLPLFIMLIGYTYKNANKIDRSKWVMAIPILISMIILITNPLTGWYFTKPTGVHFGPEYGPYITVHIVLYYTYGLIGIVAFLRTILRDIRHINKSNTIQIILISTGYLAATITIAMQYIFKVIMPVYTTSLAYLFMSICWFVAAFRYNLLNTQSVAFKQIFNSLNDSILILGDQNVIIDYNNKFQDLLGDSFKIKKGANVYKALNATKNGEIIGLMNKIQKARDNGDTIFREYITLNNETRYFEIAVQSYEGNWKLVTVSDMTTRHWKIIETLIKTIDAKSRYTCGHSYRVADYAVKIGKQVGLNTSNLYKLRASALSHDIGKIGIADDILDSDKKFSRDSEEFTEIKKHPAIGASFLEGMEDFKDIADIVRYHHERIDGKGYYGLKDREIPFLSKIIAVADTFDAMSSGRKYQTTPIREPYEIINILMENSVGTQLDTECFYGLVQVLQSEGYIQRNMETNLFEGTGKEYVVSYERSKEQNEFMFNDNSYAEGIKLMEAYYSMPDIM